MTKTMTYNTWLNAIRKKARIKTSEAGTLVALQKYFRARDKGILNELLNAPIREKK